nr:hypothetical protein [Anaerolineaceae bacterium]HPN52980.1 hypothetical protein [Anaerolineaceae bacterium]
KTCYPFLEAGFFELCNTLYITDEDGNFIYKDESSDSGASAWFMPGERGIYRLFVKCAAGETDYTLTIYEE